MRKQTLTWLSVLLVLAVTLSACGTAAPEATAVPQSEAGTSSEEQLSGTISVSGAFALYPMMTVWTEEFTKLHPDVQFDVQGGGAGKGTTDTIAGAVDIGMISRSIKDEETAQGIFWVSVTKDAVFPIINAENPVAAQILEKGITQEIFNKIYITEEIKTWGEVVGDPTITDEIHIFTR